MMHRFLNRPHQTGRTFTEAANLANRREIALDFIHFQGTDRLDCLDLLALADIAAVGLDKGIWSITIEGITSEGKTRDAAIEQWITLEAQTRPEDLEHQASRERYLEAIGL